MRGQTQSWFIGFLVALLAGGCGAGASGLASDLAGADAGGDVAQPEWALPASLALAEWRVASSAEMGEDGAAISRLGYDDGDWLPARAPGTLVAAQVEAGLLPDPYYGDALQAFPGWLPSFLPIQASSPYAVPWWWRTEVPARELPVGARTWLVFEGINYAADLWVNGQLVADRDEMVGTFREFRFDVSHLVTPGEPFAVALAVVTPDVFSDLAIYWVDWNPEPPDYNQGLWQPARVEWTGDVRLHEPAVFSELRPDGSAALTLVAELDNARDEAVTARLVGRLDGQDFAHELTLAPRERLALRLDSSALAVLRLESPRLWWPYQYGEPHLYEIELDLLVDGERADAASFAFGVREVTAELVPPNSLRFSINGQPILIRGAGWAPDMLYRDDPARDAAELAYVKHLGLNTIRLEGKLESHAFYERCDREGILLLPGWCCCDTWEGWERWEEGHLPIATASLDTQLRRLRRHPSVIGWLNGSDFHPPPEVEQAYLDVAAALDWPLPLVSNATETPSTLTGPSGMKMTGPYNWVPPNYWYEAVPEDPDALAGQVDWEWMYGGAFSFNSESSPGPSIPPIESLRRMMPEADLWPLGATFLFHAGGLSTSTDRIRIFREGLEARLGPAEGIEDFARKAQVVQYEAHRAMFEAQGRNKYFATGHIQWMLNQAWPGVIWQLYDYYLRPGGSYFGARKALRPLHVQYSYDDHSVWLVNSTLVAHEGLQVTATLVALDGGVVATREASLDLGPDGNVEALSLVADIAANEAALAPVFFLDLRLHDAAGVALDDNFYWLAATPDRLVFAPTEDNLPEVVLADMRALSALPAATVEALDLEIRPAGDETEVALTLHNPSSHVAFFVELLLLDGPEGEPLLPVLWSDNYVSLLPGERRGLQARVPVVALGEAEPSLVLRGWNPE